MRGLEFSCDLHPGTNDSLLCLNGASCLRGGTIQTCSCLPGFIDDFTALHSSNCGLYTWSLAVVFGVVTFITAIAIPYAIYVLKELRNQARQSLIWIIFHNVLNECLILSVFVQSGAYEAANILMLACCLVTVRVLVIVTLMLTTPVYAALNRPLRKWKTALYCIEIIHLLVASVLMITAAVFNRNFDPGIYNLLMSTYLLIFPSVIILLQVLLVFNAGRLQKALKIFSSPLNSRTNDFVRRLAFIQRNVSTNIFTSTIIFIYPISCFVLGSLPYQVIGFAILHGSTPLLCITCAYSLKNKLIQISSGNNTTTSSKSLQIVNL